MKVRLIKYRVLLFKSETELCATNLNRMIGDPKFYAENLISGSFSTEKDLSIPAACSSSNDVEME